MLTSAHGRVSHRPDGPQKKYPQKNLKEKSMTCLDYLAKKEDADGQRSNA